MYWCSLMNKKKSAEIKFVPCISYKNSYRHGRLQQFLWVGGGGQARKRPTVRTEKGSPHRKEKPPHKEKKIGTSPPLNSTIF